MPALAENDQTAPQFASFDELLARLDQLQRQGYRRLGQWDLAQVCQHLSYYLRGSLDGFNIRLPGILRWLIGKPMLRRVVATRRLERGGRTIPASAPGPVADPAAAIAAFRALVAGFEAADANQLHPSPLFGTLSKQQWRELHLIHCAHHFAFLVDPDAADG